jgi:hypothetical protein
MTTLAYYDTELITAVKSFIVHEGDKTNFWKKEKNVSLMPCFNFQFLSLSVKAKDKSVVLYVGKHDKLSIQNWNLEEKGCET